MPIRKTISNLFAGCVSTKHHEDKKSDKSKKHNQPLERTGLLRSDERSSVVVNRPKKHGSLRSLRFGKSSKKNSEDTAQHVGNSQQFYDSCPPAHQNRSPESMPPRKKSEHSDKKSNDVIQPTQQFNEPRKGPSFPSGTNVPRHLSMSSNPTTRHENGLPSGLPLTPNNAGVSMNCGAYNSRVSNNRPVKRIHSDSHNGYHQQTNKSGPQSPSTIPVNGFNQKSPNSSHERHRIVSEIRAEMHSYQYKSPNSAISDRSPESMPSRRIHSDKRSNDSNRPTRKISDHRSPESMPPGKKSEHSDKKSNDVIQPTQQLNEPRKDQVQVKQPKVTDRRQRRPSTDTGTLEVNDGGHVVKKQMSPQLGVPKLGGKSENILAQHRGNSTGNQNITIETEVISQSNQRKGSKEYSQQMSNDTDGLPSLIDTPQGDIVSVRLAEIPETKKEQNSELITSEGQEIKSIVDVLNRDGPRLKSKDVGYILSKSWFQTLNKHVSENGSPPGPIDSSFFKEDYYKSPEKFYEKFIFIDESSWIKLKDLFGLSDDIDEQHLRREAAYIGGNKYEFKLTCHKMTFKSTGISPVTVTETFEKPMKKDIIQEFVRNTYKFSGEIVYQKFTANKLENIKNIAKYLEFTEVIVSETIHKEKPKPQSPVYSPQSSWNTSLYGDQLPPGIRGLKNMGATCYMNSALQCLMRVSEFNQFFLTNDDIKGSVALPLKKLMRQMFENSDKPLEPKDLKKMIGQIHPQFAGSSQQDINQLITVLLDCLHDDLNKFQSVTRNEEIYDLDLNNPTNVEIRSKMEKLWYTKSNQSPIVQIFHGLFRSSLLCVKCGSRIMINYEPFSSLGLPLPIESYLKLKVHVVRGNENWRSYRISILRGSLYRDAVDKIMESGLQLNSDEVVIAKLSENKLFDGIVGIDDQIDTNPNTELCIYCLEDSVIQRPDMFLIYIRRREYLEYPPLLHIIEFCDEYAEPEAVEGLLQEFFRNNLKNFRVKSVRRGDYFPEVWIKTDEYINMKENVRSLIPTSTIELKECFQLFTMKERLSSDITYPCPQCDKQTEVFKKFDFAVLPDVLIIQLKRFTFFTERKTKIDDPVRVPFEDLKLQQDVKPKEVSYHLIAVANHYGSLNSGHYTAYGRDINHKKWFLFDDSVVRPLRFEEQKMDNAIVLVYKRDPNPPSSSTNTGTNEEGKQHVQITEL